jgi:hypothetical protein
VSVQEELNDKPLFRLTKDRLNRTDDADMAADLDSLPHVERLRAVEAPCRNDPLSLAELVSVLRHQLENVASGIAGFHCGGVMTCGSRAAIEDGRPRRLSTHSLQLSATGAPELMLGCLVPAPGQGTTNPPPRHESRFGAKTSSRGC